MAVDDVSRVMTTLFTAPTDAVVKAAAEQRRIWRDWLLDVQRLLDGLGDAEQETRKRIIREHLRLAPTWKMTAQVSVGITMRVTSLNRAEGGVTLGLGVGLLQGSGTFGFLSESTTESILQARAQYALGNEAEVSLADYLDTLGVSLADATDVSKAIARLGEASTPLPTAT
jgi:hypothetical protein